MSTLGMCMCKQICLNQQKGSVYTHQYKLIPSINKAFPGLKMTPNVSVLKAYFMHMLELNTQLLKLIFELLQAPL